MKDTQVTMDKNTTIGEIFPNLGDDEGTITFRFQDKFVPQLLHYYYEMCNADMMSPEEQLVWIAQKRQEVIRWQEMNNDKVKAPD